MRVDANFYGSVPMPDAGNDGPAPVDRRYGNTDFLACYDHLTHWAGTMDRLGYDTMWLTEHHFQYEGYEVTPNLILFGLHLAKETERLRLGQMFNVVPQWHPLRLAEDAAMMQILTNNRIQFGVGRGTVPREAQSLGGVVASGDNEMSAELDRINRELFEESMEIIKAAWNNETFSFTGKHFVLPPPGIPDRGSTVQTLTLVPKPIAPIDVWQAVTSPPTLDYAARVRHHAVLPARGLAGTKRWWDDFGRKAAEGGWDIGRSDARCLAVNMHVGPTRADAIRTGRNAHDEWIRFLAPYGRFRSYTMPDGTPVPFDFRPTIEDSIEQEMMLIGSPEECADLLGRYRDEVGVEHVVLFFDMPGLTRAQMDEQLEITATDVLPRIGVTSGDLRECEMAFITYRLERDGADRLLILLHGWSAEQHHLAAYVPLVDPDERFTAACPRAPHVLPDGDGASWYERTETGPDPASFLAVADSLASYAADEMRRTGVGAEQTVLAGFSQGGFLALSLALRDGAPRYAGVWAMCCAMPEVDGLALDLSPGSGGDRPALIQVGEHDAIITPERGRAAASALNDAGWDVATRGYDMAHSQRIEMMTDAKAWLATI